MPLGGSGLMMMVDHNHSLHAGLGHSVVIPALPCSLGRYIRTASVASKIKPHLYWLKHLRKSLARVTRKPRDLSGLSAFTVAAQRCYKDPISLHLCSTFYAVSFIPELSFL